MKKILILFILILILLPFTLGFTYRGTPSAITLQSLEMPSVNSEGVMPVTITAQSLSSYGLQLKYDDSVVNILDIESDLPIFCVKYYEDTVEVVGWNPEKKCGEFTIYFNLSGSGYSKLDARLIIYAIGGSKLPELTASGIYASEGSLGSIDKRIKRWLTWGLFSPHLKRC